MSEHFENRKNEVALRRFAAVSFIEQKVREGLGVVQALRLAALRPWPDENGQYSSARTLEDYWYAWKSGGFAALQPKSRGDEGTFRKLPTEVGQWLLSQVSQYPEIPLKVLYERWTQAGQQLPSLRTLYRFLRSKGYDAASLRRGRLETGPTKAFEAPFVNDLWMTDFSPGPKLNVDGKVLTTQLCLILDDHSRLIAYGAYYLTADSYAFHQTLKQAVQRRGIPYKLYTDLGRPFTNKHTQIICANLGIRLLHAKPYSAWSKGKVERCFYTLQQGFESTLKLPDNHAQSLEELNTKLTHWIQTVYHLRAHSATGISPQLRFAQAAGSLRHLDAGLELDSLFFTRIKRTVRKDGTVRIDGILYEVDLSLRALDVELRFDPYRRARIEVYCRGKACGLARLVDLQLNSQLEGSQHYDR
jgi:transposase InsO family protein